MRDPDVLLRVDEHAGDRAEDPVVGHLERPRRIDLERGRVSRGFGLFSCKMSGSEEDEDRQGGSGEQGGATVVHAAKAYQAGRLAGQQASRLTGQQLIQNEGPWSDRGAWRASRE